MSHLTLDARAILHYLNELGYRNISAVQLKEFLKDLRKLIKYEEHMAINALQDDYFENLHRQTTASYRAKIQKEKSKQSVSSNGKRAGSHSGQYRRSSETMKRRRESSDKENRLQHDLYQERPTTSKAADKANIRLATKQSATENEESDLKALKLLREYSSEWFNEHILKNRNTQTSQEWQHSKDQLKVGNGVQTNQLLPKHGSKFVTSHAGQEEDGLNRRQQALLAQGSKISGNRNQKSQEKRPSLQQLLSNRGSLEVSSANKPLTISKQGSKIVSIHSGSHVRASLEKHMSKEANELPTISKEGSKIVSSHLGLERDVINQRQPNASTQATKIGGRGQNDQESHLSLPQLSLNRGSINIRSLEKQLSKVASDLQTISIQDSKIGSTNSGFKEDIQNQKTQGLPMQNGKVDGSEQKIQERRSSQQPTFSNRNSVDVRGSLQKHVSKDENELQTISKQASKVAPSNQSLKESILNEKRTSKMSGSAQNSQESRQSSQQLLFNRDDENIRTSWDKRLSKNTDELENGQKFSKENSKTFNLNFSGSQEKRVSEQPPLSKQASKLADSVQGLQDNDNEALDKYSHTQKRHIRPLPAPPRHVSINTGNNATQNARTRSSGQAVRTHSYSPSSGSSGTPTGIRRSVRSAAQLTRWEPASRKKGGQEQNQKQLRSRSPSCSSSGLSLRSRSRSRSVLGSRSSSTTRLRKLANADPVALYQYYKNEWNYFRQQIPGESKHEQLRWHIRQRLNPLDE
ncbi:hyls1 centriolar and ciliogenesis associated [Glossina fuscipes fuscipes]